MNQTPPAPPSKPRHVRCPACGGDSLYAPENPFRPFCSARCKNMDFGAWASESYRVGSDPSPAEELDGSSLPPGPRPH